MAPPIIAACKGPPCHDIPGCTIAGSCRYRSSADEARERMTAPDANCITEPDGACVSQTDCMHTPPKVVADFTGKVDGGGYKAVMDNPKDPLELIPPQFLFAIAAVLLHGKKKYAANNWMRGMSLTTVFGALLRHSFAWFMGEQNDKDSGLPHLWHAGCCIMFLIFFTHGDKYKPFDDRVFAALE